VRALVAPPASVAAEVAEIVAAVAARGDAAVLELERRFGGGERPLRLVRIHELLAAIPGVACVEPQGAFYAFPSFEGVLGRELRGRTPASTLELAEVILDEARVAIVPGEAFGAPGYARLSYALGDDDLVEGVTRIADLLETRSSIPV
jgi:aspartate/methionine/tyrosine aminotransferase